MISLVDPDNPGRHETPRMGGPAVPNPGGSAAQSTSTIAPNQPLDPTPASPSEPLSQGQRVDKALNDFLAPRSEDDDGWEEVVCPACNRTEICTVCLGTRKVRAYRVQLRWLNSPGIPILCPACQGTRMIEGNDCHYCNGTGTRAVSRELFRRELAKPYARPFSKYTGAAAWRHGSIVGLVLGPFAFVHIKRLGIERAKILPSFMRGDEDFPGIRFGATSAFLLYALVIFDYFFRAQANLALTTTLVLLVLWAGLWWIARRS